MNEIKGIKYLIKELYSLKWGEEVSFHEVLRRLYIDQNKSMQRIADELRIGVGSVYNFLREEGIQREITWS